MDITPLKVIAVCISASATARLAIQAMIACELLFELSIALGVSASCGMGWSAV